VRLYVAYIVQGGERSRQIAGRMILDDFAMPVSEADIRHIEDVIARRAEADIAFVTYMHELED
jgi:hypothetical protein